MVITGGYIFVGTTPCQVTHVDSGYADSSYYKNVIGPNEHPTFTTPRDIYEDITGNPNNVHVGFQVYWRYEKSTTREYDIYDLWLE